MQKYILIYMWQSLQTKQQDFKFKITPIEPNQHIMKLWNIHQTSQGGFKIKQMLLGLNSS
jgi:hypothetical protein